MTSLSEQLSAVRQSQWEAQLDIFQTLTNRAIDSAEQLIALNMRTSRASVEQATGTVQQLLRMTDPRDLLTLGSQAQGQWQQLFSYSRELLGIAAGTRLRTWSSLTPKLPASAPVSAPLLAAPAVAPAVEPIATLMEQASIAIAGSSTVTGEIASAAADTGAALAEATLTAAAPGVAKTADAVKEAGEAAAEAAPRFAGAEAAPGKAAPDETPAAAEAPAPAAPSAPTDQPTELEAEKTGASESETPAAPAAEPAAESAAEPAPQPSAAFTMQSAILPAGEVAPLASDDVALQAEALIENAIADEVPTAKAKPVARALNKVAPKPASTEHPIASTVALQAGEHVELPVVTPPAPTPPVHLSNGPAPAERRRSSRKK